MSLTDRIDRVLGKLRRDASEYERQLHAGTREELAEHGKTLRWAQRHPTAPPAAAAAKIARDHLKEDPDYYADKVKRKTKLQPPRLKLLGRRGRLKIYQVDGIAVRKKEIAFTMGGTDAPYPDLIPPYECWIDDTLGPMDQKYTILHELHERRLMKTKGMSYDEAHEYANQIEQKYRKADGRGLNAALRRERGQ